MTKKFYLLPFFFVLGVWLSSCESKTKYSKTNDFSRDTVFIRDAVSEVDVRFLANPIHGIIYSKNVSNKYELFQWKNGQTRNISRNRDHVFRPFIFSNSVNGLVDPNGSENFSFMKSVASLDNGSVKFVKSSKKGAYILYQPYKTKELHLFDVRSKNDTILHRNFSFLKTSFSDDESKLVISKDEQLIYLDLISKEGYELVSNVAGRKYNPFIYKKKVFYSSNSNSEFFQIYESAIDAPDFHHLVLSDLHDLRLPKFDGEYLYFIEILSGQYLLKRSKYPSGKIETITKSGVVYDFYFIGKDSVAFVYSDLNIPRNVFLFNGTNVIPVSSFDTIQNNLELKFIEKSTDKSSAFVIKNKKRKPKAIICLFHGAPDFSPRWDPILNALCDNDYMVVIPNYPGSFGYGKSFQNQNLNHAVKDMIRWNNFLAEEHNMPIYYLGISQGSSIMEASLLIHQKNVRSFVSLFGVSNWNFVPNEVPGLYFLGENDPIVSFEKRRKLLEENNIEFLSYENEGHGFKDKESLRKTQRKIISFFNSKNK